MTNSGSRVYVGAARAGNGTRGGIFRTSFWDGGWEQLTRGLPEETQVQAITVAPNNRDLLYLGTHAGAYRSQDGGDSWERMGLPDDAGQVWSVFVHPNNPRTLFAGTSPVGVYRSDDGGDTWRRAKTPRSGERVRMDFPCRVMRFAVAANDQSEIFAALEVDGVIRSSDGGDSWEDCSENLIELAQQPHLRSRIGSDTEIEGMLDSHALCISSALPGSVFLALRMGLFRSDDRGKTWHDMEVGRFSPLTYSRDVRVSPQDPRVLYACLSPAARSHDGSLYRSGDLGESWRRVDHDIKADATMMAVALHQGDPDQVYCASRCGQVFGTRDGGRTWQERPLPEGVRDVYAIACA
jgi:photosystem II stability/assembly factor-like uncharacterized protein